MKLSTRTRYGIRAVIELAQHEGKRPLQLKAIAERQNISVKYLEQLMSLLRSSGFVRSVRGSKGGYVLARLPEQINSAGFRCLRSVTTAECTDKDFGENPPAVRHAKLDSGGAIHRVRLITLADLVDKTQTTTASYSI